MSKEAMMRKVGKNIHREYSSISTDLFDDFFPGVIASRISLDENDASDTCTPSDKKYISDILTKQVLHDEVFKTWSKENEYRIISPSSHFDTILGTPHGVFLEQAPEYELPVLISAQTGKGKNYFVTHTLREYAKKQYPEERILYVCNRVALNYQQKIDLANATKTYLDYQYWENKQEFDNVTVTTYQSLEKKLNEDCDEFCKSFKFIVLDECHYFYSDAFFNPSTGYLLEQIPKKFLHCYRIYMSATPEVVIKPIYSAELAAILGDLKKHTGDAFSYIWTDSLHHSEDLLPKLRIYESKRDFSAYKKIYFFTRNDAELEELKTKNKPLNECKSFLAAIGAAPVKDNRIDLSKNKWIIFVPKKKYGKELKEVLVEKGIKAQYFDRYSKTCKSFEEKLRWEQLLRSGSLDEICDVLITTSVLDNGFSIKDTNVKNIVLFTDDKTEFHQQLGRVRLFDDQELNVYISKTSMTTELNEDKNNSRKELFSLYYDNEQEGKNKALAVLGKLSSNKHFWILDYIRFVGVNDTSDQVVVHMNHMARYRTQLVDGEIAKYKELGKTDPKASINYKLEWIPNPDNTLKACIDLDESFETRTAREIEEFLKDNLHKPMRKPGINQGQDELSLEERQFNHFSEGITRFGVDYLHKRRNGYGALKQLDKISKWLTDILNEFGKYMEKQYQIVATNKKQIIYELQETDHSPTGSPEDNNDSENKV